MAIERFVGVDLAWGAHGRNPALSNETGLAVLDADGVVIDAGWARGLEKTLTWIEGATAGVDALMFVDAPLVVDNPGGQRPCERQVGQQYGRWHVSANTTNTASPRQAGVQLRGRLAANGWAYHDGFDNAPNSGRIVSECYPYTTLVGVAELGYPRRGSALATSASRRSVPSPGGGPSGPPTVTRSSSGCLASNGLTRLYGCCLTRSPATCSHGHLKTTGSMNTARTSSTLCFARGLRRSGNVTA